MSSYLTNRGPAAVPAMDHGKRPQTWISLNQSNSTHGLLAWSRVTYLRQANSLRFLLGFFIIASYFAITGHGAEESTWGVELADSVMNDILLSSGWVDSTLLHVKSRTYDHLMEGLSSLLNHSSSIKAFRHWSRSSNKGCKSGFNSDRRFEDYKATYHGPGKGRIPSHSPAPHW